MAIRDHFRPDVLARRAAELQRVDSELGEVERLLRLERVGATGECPSCAAVHSRGAAFCWQCGARLLEDVRPAQAPTDPETLA
jgi:predicted amidophosphoribosyltransferase